MKNNYKYDTKKDHAIIYCPKLNGACDAEVIVDKSFLRTAKKISGTWVEMVNPYYPSEQYPTTIGTIHKNRFIDMKRVITGLQNID